MQTADYNGTALQPLGQNIERIRLYLGIKQQALAAKMGMSQQAISMLEKRAFVDAAMLTNIAGALGVDPALIRYFDEEKARQFINGKALDIREMQSGGYSVREIDLLQRKIIELYKRLQKSEQDRMLLLQQGRCPSCKKEYNAC